MKFLGVYVDDLFNWNYHITCIKSKLSKRVGMMCRCSHLLNRSSMHILYCSLLLPHLTYCVEIWGNTYLTNINVIVLLQNNYFRNMYGAFLDKLLLNYKQHCLSTKLTKAVCHQTFSVSLIKGKRRIN